MAAVSKIAKVGYKVAMASVIDDMFFNGAGKQTAKYVGRAAVTYVGRAAVTAALKVMGYRNIRWYD